MTTPKRPRKAGAAIPKTRRTTTRKRTPKPKAIAPPPVAAEALEQVEPEPALLAPPPEPVADAVIVTGVPEPGFAASVPPPEPPPPRPTRRRGVFFDVENTSRSADISRVLEHLALDWLGWTTQFTAVGNWRVIGHDTARLLAQHGAALVHSAPSVGVRDWSDLRIAVSAGVWLAGARPGDVIEIVSDDQAFDAVGDVAASLGITFRRTSYRALAGGHPAPRESRESRAPSGAESRSRRSRRSGRRGGRSDGRSDRAERPAPEPTRVAVAASEKPPTAPHDEIVGVVRDLLATAPGGVSLDALANALRERGFSRPPGSPRLITRLRRIKELDVSRNGTIRLVGNGAGGTAHQAAAPAPAWATPLDDAPIAGDVIDVEAEPIPADEPGAATADLAEPTGAAADSAEPGAAAEGAPRRRRRRGGRRRRGRRNGAAASAASAPDGA